MEFRIDEKSKDRLANLFDGEQQKKDEKKKLILAHLERYHFNNWNECLFYLKSGHKVLIDKHFYNVDISYITWVDGEVIIHRPKEETRMSESEFKDKFYYSLIPYNDYLLMFHREG